VVYFDGSWWQSLPPPIQAAASVTAFVAFGTAERPRIAVGTRHHGLFLWDGSAWRQLTTADGLPGLWVRDLAADGEMLRLVTDGGLAVLRPDAPAAETWVVPRLPSETVLALCPAPGDGWWLLGPTWLARVGDTGFTVTEQDLQIPTPPGFQRVVLRAGSGGVFAGAAGVLLRLLPKTPPERLGPVSGLLAEGATDLFLDLEGTLWISGPRGVSQIVSFRFATYDHRHGLLDDEVTAVLQRGDGSMVLGHQGGITLLDGHVTRTVTLIDEAHRSLPTSRVLDLAEDRSGTVWIAADRLGLFRLGPDLAPVAVAVPESEPVSSVQVSASGRLWVTTSRRLLRMGDHGLIEVDVTPPPTNYVRRLFIGGKDDLYLATKGHGAYRLRDGAWTQWRSPGSEGTNNVFALLDRGPELLVGTTEGLFTASGDSLARPSDPGLQIRRVIYFLVADAANHLWLGTDDGVLRWDGARLDHFTVEDGLGGRETNRAAGVLDTGGHVWIGTRQGVSVYYADFDPPRAAPPGISLVRLDASGVVYALDDPIHLPPDRADLIFHYRTVSFSGDRRLILRTRLEGMDGDWVPLYPSPDGVIRYPNLPPGRYVFHLQAGTPQGDWSEVVSSPEIVIARSWWPMVVTVVLVILGLLVAGLAAENRRLRRALSPG
jgi:hypothetical protein